MPTSLAGSAPVLEIREWRYRDGLEPPATAADFDDSKWEVIRNAQVGRGKGGTSSGWYRTVLTVPERMGGIPIGKRPLQLVVLANAYAEIWVDGDFKIQYDPAQPSTASKNQLQGYEIAGFNKPNVIRLGARKPGDKLAIAALVINGPISRPVSKYSIRYARLEFASGPAK